RATRPTYFFILGSLSCHFCLQIHRYPAWTQVDCAMQPQGLEMFIGEKLDATLAKNVNNLPLAVQD
ncbi:hypothetical protein FCV25MIE_27880, partial [Fagus crenata]